MRKIDGMSALVGIVGDFRPDNVPHQLTNASLAHLGLRAEWVPTDTIGSAPEAVKLAPGSRAAGLYGVLESTEEYYCNYGVNPDYQTQLDQRGLRATGVGDEGEARIVEIPRHRFFLATLFLPQARSAPGKPHPLLAGFAEALS